MSPLDAAFHDWADANEGESSCAACFRGGWEARAERDLDQQQAAYDQQQLFWRRRLEGAEAERDRAMMLLATTEYERAAFKRQRDELTRALSAAKEQP